ncbi:zinc finger BED domain-containing protein DAYSLEEPER-like [Humulus lupulus]|uniref:zinc finger BED domain-containing protein DAYSLEEPER-like n=1 Tax=Humulus lupulus TaxID=3486 RepID=UPI002B407B0E|nr:zinc finger BED domain-containing protein DAYSLEEPER-like [Humulus lupulus]XP_062089891.1 zinc finger BED domain-containing protein DAYSLEEPER-like [Humulus lupulus]XP_062089892.1 zinc finger BED domain-containing protein DAYSLEEPER-like [Humulus lupulus]
MDALLVPTDNNELLSSDILPNKRRRKKSIVWEHFTVKKVDAGHIRAYCKQCEKSFAYITGSKLAGTSHLKRHIALGICPVSRQKNQLITGTPGSRTAVADPPKRRYRTTPVFPTFIFDQNRCSHEIAKMIVLHEYPLHIVEQTAFVEFIRTLQPQFKMPSFNTVQGDCVAMYLTEKQSLLNLVNGIPGRVSLALDLWVSNQDLGYVFVTGHFIDGDWNLHRRILNVIMVPSPDSAESFSQAIVSCLSDWHLEGRLFTLTLDQSFVNETAFDNLRGFLSVKNHILLNGQLLVGNCFARVLSNVAQDALGTMREIICKIRENVKYVKTSETHEEKFLELKQQLQVPSMKDLVIDDQTKWNTTYHMLVAACELQEVFACLDTSDPDYKITPSMDEWRQVEALCMYLKYLFDAANILTAPTYPTANVFFPEASKIQMDLIQASMSDDPFISYLTRPLHEKFDKYWSNCCLVLAVAVVMDPRFKMKLVEFTFSKIYGENAETWIRIVDDGIHELFIEYMTQMLALPEVMMEEGDDGMIKSEAPHDICHDHEGPFISTGDGLSDFEIYISEITSSQQMKSELDQYLEESLLPRVQEFDVLSWWNQNRSKYPTLSRMASDILSIPVSTVAPECVFDIEIKKMDNYRSSLHPVTVEALICAKDWLQYGSSTQTPSPSFEVTNAIVKMEF